MHLWIHHVITSVNTYFVRTRLQWFARHEWILSTYIVWFCGQVVNRDGLMILGLWVRTLWPPNCRCTHKCYLVDQVGIVSCAIHCIMHVHSPNGDIIITGMYLKTSIAMCIIDMYDDMIASKGQYDPNHYKLCYRKTVHFSLFWYVPVMF